MKAFYYLSVLGACLALSGCGDGDKTPVQTPTQSQLLEFEDVSGLVECTLGQKRLLDPGGIAGFGQGNDPGDADGLCINLNNVDVTEEAVKAEFHTLRDMAVAESRDMCRWMHRVGVLKKTEQTWFCSPVDPQ